MAFHFQWTIDFHSLQIANSTSNSCGSLTRYEIERMIEISACIQRGWFVFPAYCGKNQRAYLLNEHIEDATDDIESIMTICHKNPVNHWRVRLGSLSGTYVLVVSGALGRYTLSRLCGDWACSDTLRATMGDGRQYFFLKHPYAGFFRKEARIMRLGLQVLDEGDSIPIPCSATDSGGYPQFENPEATIGIAPGWIQRYAFL
jgi:hypothetical protein